MVSFVIAILLSITAFWHFDRRATILVIQSTFNSSETRPLKLLPFRGRVSMILAEFLQVSSLMPQLINSPASDGAFARYGQFLLGAPAQDLFKVHLHPGHHI